MISSRRLIVDSKTLLVRIAMSSANDTTAAEEVAIVTGRIVLFWVFVYYGSGKLFGWFNGPGIHRTAIFFSTTAHLHPGGFFAVLGGLIEFGAALALVLGIGTRLGALALIGDQAMAIITVTGKHGINSLTATPGYEFNLVLIALALVVLALGSGRFSVDALLARRLRAVKFNWPVDVH